MDTKIEPEDGSGAGDDGAGVNGDSKYEEDITSDMKRCEVNDIDKESAVKEDISNDLADRGPALDDSHDTAAPKFKQQKLDRNTTPRKKKRLLVLL